MTQLEMRYRATVPQTFTMLARRRPKLFDMRLALVIPAVLLVLVGGVFALQGAGFLPSAVMHGKPEWLVIGTVMVLVGLFLGYRGMGRRRSPP